jgi:hypothetical protein
MKNAWHGEKQDFNHKGHEGTRRKLTTDEHDRRD